MSYFRWLCCESLQAFPAAFANWRGRILDLPLVCRSLYFQGLWSNRKSCKRPSQEFAALPSHLNKLLALWRNQLAQLLYTGGELLGKSKNLATHGGNVAGLMFQLTVLEGFKLEVVQWSNASVVTEARGCNWFNWEKLVLMDWWSFKGFLDSIEGVWPSMVLNFTWFSYII